MGILDVPGYSRSQADRRFVPGSFSAIALAEKCRQGLSANIGIAGDSTANKPYEFAMLGLTRWLSDYPRQSLDYYEWDGTSAYGAVMPMVTGIAARATVMRDEFDRVAADLIGTSPTVPNGSNLWTVNGNGAGDWSVDGSDAVASTDATRGQALYTVPTGDIEVTVTAVVPASQTARVYVKRVDDSNNLSMFINKSASGGQYRVQLIKIIAGVQTTLAQSDLFFVNPQIAEEDLTVTTRVVGSRVTASINGVYVGGTLSGGDVTALSSATKIGLHGSAVTGVKFRRIEAASLTATTAGGTVAVYNGSKDGTVLSYQEGLVSSMFPTATPLDLLLVNSGHNYGSASPATYQAAIDSFIAAFRTQQADTAIAIATQNPRQTSFATYIAEHAARCESLVAYCAANGYGLVPTFAEFIKSPAGLDMVQADGVHPTGGWTGGSGRQATALVNWLRAASGVATDSRAEIEAEAIRARNAENLTSGTVADARLAIATRNLPAYAGRRTNPYNPMLNVYNWKASNTRILRAGLARAMAGTGRCTYLFVGDSAMDARTGGVGVYDRLNAWPLVMRDLLAVGKGVPIGGDGVIRPASPGGAQDPRVVAAGGWNQTAQAYAIVASSGATLTITPENPCTTIEVWYSLNSGTFTASIDGASSGSGYAAVTPAGGTTWAKVTLTAALGLHTIVITTTSATATSIANINAYGASGLVVQNAAYSGSSINDWITYTLWYQLAGVVELTQPYPRDAIFFGLGGNDIALHGRTPTQMKADMITLLDRWAPAYGNQILVVPNQAVASAVPNATWDEWAGYLYDLADTYDIPLIDYYGRVGSNAQADAVGFHSLDATHMNSAGYRDQGRQAASILGS